VHRVEHKKLGSHHLATAEKILAHPTSHNLEWRDVAALLEEIGSIEEEANGRFVVTIGAETQVFDRPRDKDLDTQQTVDLRRMLNAAGFTAENLGG
jgi:hypothetical protein